MTVNGIYFRNLFYLLFFSNSTIDLHAVSLPVLFGECFIDATFFILIERLVETYVEKWRLSGVLAGRYQA